MSRKIKSRAQAEPEQGADPATPYPGVAPHASPTTALVADALRRNQTEAGPVYARAELIAAFAGCLLYSVELDGLATTLALLADAAIVLERGFSNVEASPGSRLN